jgi:subtilisin family serine protease
MSPSSAGPQLARRVIIPALRPRSSLSASFVVALGAILSGIALSDADASFGARITGGALMRHEVHQALDQQPTARVLVTLQEPAELGKARRSIAALRSHVASVQAGVLAGLPPSDFELIYRYQAVPALAGRVSANGLDLLAGHRDVVDVALDAQGSAATGGSVPLVHADEAHAGGVTGAGVIVAVLDSGIDSDHPDLADDIAYEACFLSSGGCPGGSHAAEDDHGHGTNVSGIITGAGTVASVGVAPDAQIAAYKVLNDNGLGRFSDWVAALDDIIANHPEVDIVNMSLQSGSSCPAGPTATAIRTLRDRGVATFIASGNHGAKGSFTIPACITEGLSVGATYDASLGRVNGWKTSCSDATTDADQVACWSDSDESLDLLAPGAAITAARSGGGTVTFYGTSQAAPHAAGVAALLLEVRPDLSVDEIESRMEATGALVTDDLDDGDPSTNRTTPRVDARVALLADHDDTDGDGCTDAEELGSDASLGGRRDPLNPWDFYDANGDGIVNVFDDILAVVGAFGPSTGANYDPLLDRSPPPPGAEPWDLGPPDGTINLSGDILGVASQFGHTCAGPP